MDATAMDVDVPDPSSSQRQPLDSCSGSKLLRVSIPWSEERHKERDQVILDNDSLCRFFRGKLEDINASALLSIIVVGASELLNQKYRGFMEALSLIQNTPGLLEEINAAWKEREFATIRELKILQRVDGSAMPPSNSNPSMSDATRLRLSQAFNETNYIGGAVKAFKAYLKDNCRAFATGDPSSSLSYYGKYCSIVQSSGTGKSRLIVELAKSGVFVVYANLRPITDTNNYPLRDEIPSTLLASKGFTRRQYEGRCSAFFAALFTVIKRELLKIVEGTNRPDPDVWCKLFGLPESSKRVQFFESVQEEFDTIFKTFGDLQSKKSPRQPLEHAVSQHMQPLSTASSTKPGAQSGKNLPLSKPPFVGEDKLKETYKDLVNAFPELFESTVYAPQLVLALDEAACLRVLREDGYVPAHVVCTAISLFSKSSLSPIWVVFASTESRVADFSAPNQLHDSERVLNGGEKLFPPFTELGFDQLAPPLETIELDEIGHIGHISRFGRPLWSAVVQYLNGSRDEIERTAQMKLLRSEHFNKDSHHQSLAVLGQRFGLDVMFGHPLAVGFLEKGIASHLRICIATTADRAWRFTCYPSEPLLSHAAAQIMWHEPGFIEAMLEHLKAKLEGGMIDRGKNGELVCRLLLLLAKDACARQTLTLVPSSLLHCRSVPVCAWLEQLFGANAWPEDKLQRDAAQKAFQHATINFSHWVALSEHIRVVKGRGKNKKKHDFDAEDWTKRHFVRTSAVQCSHSQPRIDQMIPMRFTNRKNAFSHALVSDKFKDDGSPADVSQITRKDDSINCENGLPWIAISLDLGVATKFKVTYPKHSYPTKSRKSPCLRIYAAGSTRATFPFMTEGQEQAIGSVLRRSEPRKSEKYLTPQREQTKFGSTTLPKNMQWELKGGSGEE